MKSDYWAKRGQEELNWQAQQAVDLDKYMKNIGGLYQKTIDNINREIKADLAFSNGKLLQAEKMPEYERLAQEMVAKADAMRAKGHHITRKDFSKDVNDRLKVYNASMRINRNEILKSMIGEQLVGLGIEHENALTNKLWDAYTKEKQRQAGILGVTTKAKVWSNADTASIIYGQIGSANFSKRIWTDIDGLKGTLDGLVSTAIIRGDNPKEMAKWLTGEVATTVGNQKYAAERLARTETARVQFRVQQRTAILNDYKYVKWYAEGSACKYCKAIVGDDVGYGDGIYPVKEVPDIPVHPNCLCSIGAYWVEDDKNNVEVPQDDETADVTKDHGFILEKPMSMEEADHMNANPFGWGNTPEERQQYIEAKKAVDSYSTDVDQIKEGLNQKTDESREAWVKRVHAANDKIHKRYEQYQKDWQAWHKLYEEVYPYRINCQRCVPTYEMRRRGYKVTALPMPESNDHELKFGIPRDIFLNDDGSPSEGERLKAGSNARVTTELMKKMQVGERGTVTWGWAGRGNDGHIINVERTKEGLQFVDAQNDIVTDTFEKYMDGKSFKKKTGSGSLTVKLGVNYNRVDDKQIDWKNINKVVKPSD